MQNHSLLVRMALGFTKWVGSPSSIIVHTILFLACFAASWLQWVAIDQMLLMLTTIVSLEAIYLAIFIQMTLNLTNEAVEDISEDVEEMQEDVAEIQEDVGEIQGDVDELQEDIKDISEDVEEITEDDKKDDARDEQELKTLETIQNDLRRLVEDITRLQHATHKDQHPHTAQQ